MSRAENAPGESNISLEAGKQITIVNGMAQPKRKR